MGRLASSRGYGLNLSKEWEPTVSIIVPTYNESPVVEKKLRNLAEIDYPREKVELIVVDSASSDGTAQQARKAFEEMGFNGVVLEETERKGKASGLNTGLKRASGELVCISDAECLWNQETLRNAVKYLSDPSVGSVSGVHASQALGSSLPVSMENSYRSIYRAVRIGESKVHSTPVAEGEIQLFRRADMPSFNTRIGGDDTDAALAMVEKGLRAISAEDVVFFEPTPSVWGARFRQKIRRGQHVIQAFLGHRRLFTGRSTPAGIIFPMEFFLYAVNPVLFVPFAALTIWVVAIFPLVLYMALAGLAVIILVPSLRRMGATYLTNNVIMLAALYQEARGNKQLTWEKIEENRLGQ
ncbi:glycosyltransferase [Candidatus Bathyarchaeota archaeon]|nr:MAG: glycosyltransferase [Candidatus Bathyarchaeota archaeon]